MEDVLETRGGGAPVVTLSIPPDSSDPNQRSGIEIQAINEHRGTWMSTYRGARDLRIMDLVLPGSHDAGMDKEAPYTNSLETTQDKSPWYQIMSGIRVLDLRIQFFSGYSVNDPKRFQIFHHASSRRTVRGDILQAVTNWRNTTFPKGNPKLEIIILDFHQFKGFTDEAHYELMKLLKDYFGDLIIRPEQRNLYVRELWQGTGRVVVSYHDVIRDNEFFWDLDQRYEGSGYISTDRLKDFMNVVASTPKPDPILQSIQCHKVTKFYSPDDFQDQIGRWFYSNHEIGFSAWIQNFNIINTDWSTRGAYIDYCINACEIRADRFKELQTIWPERKNTWHIPCLQTEHLRVQLSHGFWSENLHLPVPRTGVISEKISVINLSGNSSILHMEGSNYGSLSMELKTGATVALEYDGALKAYRCIDPPPFRTEISNFNIVAGGDGEITLSWDNVPGNKGYEVVVDHENTVEYIKVSEAVITIKALPGAVYSVRTNVTGPWLYSKCLTYDPPAIDKINNIRLESDGGYPLTLSWDPVPEATLYEVLIKNGDDIQSVSVVDSHVIFHDSVYGVFTVKCNLEGRWIYSDDVTFLRPSEVQNFRNAATHGNWYPIEFVWDPVPGVSEYTLVVERDDGSIQNQVVHQPSFTVERYGTGNWHVETEWEGISIMSRVVNLDFPPDIRNLSVNAGGGYPITFTWEPLPGITRYTAVQIKYPGGGTEIYEVDEALLTVSNGGQGTWHVESQVEGRRVRSDTIHYLSEMLDFHHLNLEFDGSYPFTVWWEPLPGVSHYIVECESGDNITYHPVFGNTLEIYEGGIGRWTVTAVDTEHRDVRSLPIEFPPKVKNFLLEGDGGYPFTLSWDAVPLKNQYYLRHQKEDGSFRYITVEGTSHVVTADGAGSWCVQVALGNMDDEIAVSETRRFV